MSDYIDIVFDGPPAPESGRFIEAEDSNGASIGIGEWVERGAYWCLRIPDFRKLQAENEELKRKESGWLDRAKKVLDDAKVDRAECNRLRLAIRQGRVALSAAHAAWDSDQDSRVGKILLALLGEVPGYRPDTDVFAAAALTKCGEASDE